LDYGQTVKESLADQESRWLFHGQQGDMVGLVFERADSASTPQLVVLGPGGEAVARGGGVDKFRLPVTGQFIVIVGAGKGTYSLSLRLVRAGDVPTATIAPSPTSLPPGRQIQIGASETGTLTTGDALGLWSFEGEAGMTITIRMEAVTKDLRPVLRLFGPDQASLGGDESGGEGQSALLGGVLLPLTGTYYVQTWGGGWTGDYRLSIQLGTARRTLTPTPTLTPFRPTLAPTLTPSITPTVLVTAQNGARLELGKTVRGEITGPEQVDRFTVFAPANAVISLGMFPTEGSLLVPAFEVYAPNGDKIAEALANQPGARPGEALVSGLSLPATGAYIIFAHAAPDTPTGAYTLTAGSDWTLREVGGGEGHPDTTYPGALFRGGDRETWVYNLPANATISADVSPEQGDFNPVLEIVGPDGAQLAATRGGSGGAAQVSSLFTPKAGAYLVRITAFRNESVGSYRLTLRLISVEPTATFAPVDATLGVSVQQGESYTYTFQAVPGDLLLVEAHATTPGAFDPVIELYGPSGRRLARADDLSADNADAALQLALNDGIGVYQIKAFGYALMPGTFTLRVKTG
jgi:hypothetical protein